MNNTRIAVDDVVTTRIPTPAYYSAYAGNPICTFTEKDRGIVGAIKVPYVSKTYPHGDYFVCVDFEKYGRVWRVGLDYAHIVKLAEPWPLVRGVHCYEAQGILDGLTGHLPFAEAVNIYREPLRSALVSLTMALDGASPLHARNECGCMIAVLNWYQTLRTAFKKE